MDRRVTLIVFLSFWCLSHQQGREMTLCRGNRSVLAYCGAGRTPFRGQLPPGWGRTCQAGTTQCDITSQNTVGSTQYYTEYQCDSETWNLNYLCLPADQAVDICQDVRQTSEGNTSLVHGHLMASRGDKVACTCVVTRSPGQNSNAIIINLYKRHLVQPYVAEVASCQGKLTLRDTLKSSVTFCLLKTRPTGPDSSEVSLWPGYFVFLDDTNSLTITYELEGGAPWGPDQLLPFALRLSGTGSYDIECGRLDDDVTDREFESTSIGNPTTTSPATASGDDPVIDTTVTFAAEAQPNKGNGNPTVAGLTIGLAVALAVVVLVVLVIVVCCFLHRRRMTRDKPPQADGDREAAGGDGVEVDPSDTYATVDRSRRDQDSADLIIQENTLYGSHSQPIEN